MNINKIPTKLVYGDTHDSNRPHVYVNNIELTNQQFKLNEKINSGMIFNMRKKFND